MILASTRFPLSRFLVRGLTVAATAWLAVWLIDPKLSWMASLALSLASLTVFMGLDWGLLRPQHRLAERLANNVGQLLISLVVVSSVAAFVAHAMPAGWALLWLVLASVALAVLEVFNDRITAWHPASPRLLLAGACQHVSQFAGQLQHAAVQMPREQAVSWLNDVQTRHLSDRVLIFDSCLHAPQAQEEQAGCPTAPERQAGNSSARSAAQKRLFDLLFAAVLLCGCAPVLLVVALIVRLQDGGPALFRQQRLGLHGSRITVLKFRSMRVAAGNDPLAPQACNDDPRITPVGKWMRHWGIDELPQLFNVLRGDMSMVGPRPHAVAHDLHYGANVAGYSSRQGVRPGITGLAQIRGRRGETRCAADMAARVQDDREYIARQSFMLDLFILLATPLALLRSANGPREDNGMLVPERPTAEPAARPFEGSHCAGSEAESV